MSRRSARRDTTEGDSARPAWYFNKHIPETLARLVSAEQAIAAVGSLDDIDGETVHDVRVGVGGKRRVANAIYDHLRDCRIRYEKEGYAPSSENTQRVRAPAEMVQRRRGTCLDLSLLFAGVALAEGLAPMVIVFDGHAMAGVVATNFDLGDASNTNGENVQNWVAQGSLIPVECTGFAVGRGVQMSFDEAVESATNRIASTPPEYSLDMQRLQTECDISPYDPPAPPEDRFSPRRVLSAVWKTIGAAALIIGLIAGVKAIWFSGENQLPFVTEAQIQSVRSGDSIEIDLLEFADDDGGVDQLVATLDAGLSASGGTITVSDDSRTAIYTAPDDHLGRDSFVFYVRDSGGKEIARTQAIVIRQGDINGSPAIAVMRLTVGGENTSADDLADDASARVSRQTADAFGRSPLADEFGLVGPNEMGDLLETVEDLANVVGADLVVHGLLTADSSSSEIGLRFYLSPEELTNAREVANDYPLITMDTGVSGASALIDEIDDRLPTRLDGLAELFEGVRLFNRNKFEDAKVHLENAERLWPTPQGTANGKEAVLMLLGNVELEALRFDQAQAYYGQARDIAENSARPRFGLNEIAFLRNKGPKCGGDTAVDLEELERVRAEFELLSLVEEPIPFTAPRARVEVGRVILCLHQYDNRDLSEAAEAFEMVIETYGRDDSLREIVAEAYQRLAVVQGENFEWTAAAESYEEAITTLRGDANKEGTWHRLVARIYLCELDDSDRAERHYAESERLLGGPSLKHECAGAGE